MGHLSRLRALLTPCLVLAGCMLGPDYTRPAVATPDAWRNGGASTSDSASLANLPWWELFSDEELRGYLEAALEANHDLRIAVTRVDQARARLGVTRAAEFPQLDGNGSFSRQRFSQVGTFFLPPGESAETDDFSLSADASFELDVWGRLRRATEAASADLLASEATRHTVVMTLVADVATTYLRLRELDLELEITRNTVAARKKSLGIVRDRYEAGLTSVLDVRQAEADLESTAAEIPDLERQITQSEDQLNVLLGRNPGAIPRGKPLTTQTFPPEVPAGLPSALLERRPDIRQAEDTLIAANAEIGVAKAAFFPQIFLTGTFGVESVALSDLFTGPARTWQFGPSVTLPIFHGGRNRANLQLAEAQQQEALARYEQTIQQGFREAEDALIAHRKARETLVARREAAQSSREALSVAEQRYTSGLTSYLAVLDTQRSLFAAEIAESRTLLAQLVAVVQLYRALGGGWSPQQSA
jgi:multidrug efflux system outer membrane protein